MDSSTREVGAPRGITNRHRPGPIRIISGAGAGSDSLLALAARRRSHALSLLAAPRHSHPYSGNYAGGLPFQPSVGLRLGIYNGGALAWNHEDALPTGGLHRRGDQNISSGLSEESITNSLKTRICQKVVVEEEEEEEDNDDDCCVIRMEKYQNEEKIGFLDCEHEYHAHCLKKWLLRKNLCPICKAPAITSP